MIDNYEAVKGLTYDKRPNWREMPNWKQSLFTEEKDCFQSGISLHFWPFVVRYAFRIFIFRPSTTLTLYIV